MRGRGSFRQDRRTIRGRPIRLYRVASGVLPYVPPDSPGEAATHAPPSIQPIASGKLFRVVSPPEQATATPQLAQHLSQALEQFAQANGFTEEKPLAISFGRGTLGLHRSNRLAASARIEQAPDG